MPVGPIVILQTQSRNTSLILAAQNSHLDCVRLLLEAGADVNAKDTVRIYLRSCFDFMSQAAHLAKCIVQFDRSAESLCVAQQMGRTALFWAVFSDQIDMVRTLLTHGADLNVQDQVRAFSGSLAMRHACVQVFSAIDPSLRLYVETGFVFDFCVMRLIKQ